MGHNRENPEISAGVPIGAGTRRGWRRARAEDAGLPGRQARALVAPAWALRAVGLAFQGLCVLAPGTQSAWAAEAVEQVVHGKAQKASFDASFLSPSAADSSVSSLTIEPRISPKMLSRNREQLAAGFEIAVDRIREIPECREMFAKVGADGFEALGSMYFYPIGKHEVMPGVCRGVATYTLVGGGPVWVCRRFSRLTNNQAAMIIIREALHHAGLGERPHDDDAMTSAAISHMVANRCGF